MAGISEIIDGTRLIINNWANTSMPLIQNAAAGDDTIYIKNTGRYLTGGEVILRDPIVGGEFGNTVEKIIDENTIRLSSPLENPWTVAQGSVLQKVFDDQILQGIYIGEPDNIPFFPAVVVKANTTDSEWMTIDSTKEVYEITMTVYVKAASQEKGYRSNIKLAETIAFALKRNIYTLVAPYRTVAVTADIQPGDVFIKVEDTSDVLVPSRILVEDEWKQSELIVRKIIDSNTLSISQPTGCTFLLEDNPIVIVADRFIFNSWPSNITFGEIYKGTLLKSATIRWFAWEELIWRAPPRETQLH